LESRSYGSYAAESTYVVLRGETVTAGREIHWIGSLRAV